MPKRKKKVGATPIERIFRQVMGRNMRKEERRYLLPKKRKPFGGKRFSSARPNMNVQTILLGTMSGFDVRCLKDHKRQDSA